MYRFYENFIENMNLKISTLALAVIVAGGINAQVTVTVDPTTRKFLGNESEFDREKFVNIHALFDEHDSDFEKFKKDYNIDEDFIGSRRFYYPISKTKNGKIPKVSKKYSGNREVNNYVATSSPNSLFYDKTLNYGKIDFMPYIKDVSSYVAESYRDEWDLVPEFLEPFNEPMVHAADFTKGLKGAEKKQAVEAVITYICKYHREVARAVKNTPELSNMKIMGFGSAFPEFEANNFGLWNSRFKQFIDIAGEDIDILSVHLYDGSGVNNAGGRRSGSNLEAILDMLQTYSYIKLGKPLPIAVTEYGRLVPNQPEWEKATGAVGNKLEKKVKTNVSNYHPVTNSQAVRSQLHMVMSFMNRQNELVRTIPFTIGKAPQSAMYAKSSLWVKQEDGSYEYSNRKYFFEMLKDIEGEQILVNSNNVDVQALGYVDDNKLYLMLNNLNDNEQKVKLNLKTEDNLKKVSVKTLKIFDNKVPELKKQDYKAAPSEINLAYGETAVITYEYKKDIKFDKEVRRNKYYSKNYLQPVASGKDIVFNIDGVKNAAGSNVVLRLSVGRAHGLAVVPSDIKVNGKTVEVKRDVIKGYDQNTRRQFFGALEIPVDSEILKDGNNTVTVKYNDNGGFVTTAIMQVEK